MRKVTETEVQGIVIDITGLDVVDSFRARVLNDTAHMVRLLGAEVVISGMQPSVALTLVEMGRELIGVEAALDPEHGMERIHELIGARAETAREQGGRTRDE